METKELSLQEMVQIEGGRAVNACDLALGLVVAVWGIGLGMASFGLASFLVTYGGGMAVGYICHANE
jgi:hypothetical protein